MTYTRGAAADFGRYVNLTGEFPKGMFKWVSFFASLIERYQNEQWKAPADHRDTQGQYNPAVHGTDGPIQVSISGFSCENHVIQTTNELPDDFPFNLDMNSGKPLGIGMAVSS